MSSPRCLRCYCYAVRAVGCLGCSIRWHQVDYPKSTATWLMPLGLMLGISSQPKRLESKKTLERFTPKLNKKGPRSIPKALGTETLQTPRTRVFRRERAEDQYERGEDRSSGGRCGDEALRHRGGQLLCPESRELKPV